MATLSRPPRTSTSRTTTSSRWKIVQRLPYGARAVLARCHMVYGGQRRAGEEEPRGLRVVEVPVLLQVGVDGFLDGTYLGLLGDMAQRGEQVAPHLDGADHPVAVHE